MTMNKAESPYLTRKQLAERYQVSAKTISNNPHKWPKPYKFGGSVRYLLEDVQRWEDQQYI